MMNKMMVSLNRIKKFFKLNARPKEAMRRPQVNNLEESKSSKQGVLMRSWCANPESCLTDCQDYCKKLNT
jgi:hypothetical protein